MSDKYNETNDDFFAKFDEIADKKNKISETDTYSADAADAEYSYGSASSYRSDKKTTGSEKAPSERKRRSDKNKRDKTKSAKPKKAAVAKAKKNLSSAKAKGIAASSKFGGSASGQTKRKPLKKDTAGKAFLKTFVAIALIAVFAVGIYVGVIFLKAPAINTDDIYSQISQRSVMYDTDGNEIESLYFSNGNRTVIKYKDIPENMVNAVIAIEDHKFWSHSGFNFIRMIGAVKESLFGGGEVSGTSTVTQQLARNVYLSEIKSQRTLSRKITEMYCTIVLEKDLSKEQIMEAYLNTIYLGFNSYGVEAAAESYFNKKASELNLEQCAALAALPQSPDVYALVYSDYYNTQTSLPKIKKTSTVTYLYNGELTKDRREYILNNMCSNGAITEQQRDEALAHDIKDEIKIGTAADASKTSYFTDYALEQLIDDIMEEYGVSENDAENMVYTKGLKIYTSMDSKIQKIMEEEFADDDNFTSISYTRTNEDNNLVSENGVVLAYAYSNYIQNGRFTLSPEEYQMNSDGSMTILKDKRLNFYETTSSTGDDISVEFKSMYKKEDDGKFYFIESGALSIPAEYKTLDGNGNCVVSAQFFADYPEFFKKTDDGLRVSDDNFTLKQKIRQPQAAAVIIENKTGEVKGMMGGRGATGKQLYNRAVNPRQPGSSIKPIAVYGPAIQMSYEYQKANKRLSLDTSEGSDWGKYVTAGSVINDSLTKDGNGKVWPKNDDGGYHGPTTVREALQQSLNVCSYKIFQQIDRNEGADYCLDMLKKVGITTLNDESDCNPAAISLGGLTYGLTPLEEAAAYETFVNGGVYKTPIFYTKVLDSNNNTLFEKQAEETQVYDPGVAWIMTDVLHTVVTKGIGRSAYINSQPAGGKTGTTSNMYDIWFSGFTPYYSMALWMGNDINMSVSNYSYKAAGFWAAIMERVCEDLPRASFSDKPANVTQVNGEYYTEGTYSKVAKRKTKTKKSKKETESTTESQTVTLPPATTKGTTAAPPPTEPEPEPQPEPEPEPQPEPDTQPDTQPQTQTP
ncbi:MAG: transglycosylase domain-containing protein [Firmicutes bacterium]|nr:transglycosylase domain-containing protein [Bacillota bacterium]